MREVQIVGIIMLAAPFAAAEPAGAQAEVLFRQGRELLAAGKTAEACEAFAASQKLDPAPPTLLNLAACREKNGQLATAWGLFLDAEHQTRNATDASTKQLHKAAIDHAAALEPRLSTLAIVVAEDVRVGGLEILRDHETIDAGAWNKTLPIDGGTYRVTAHAPGNSEWTAIVTVDNEHDAKSIDVPKLKAPELRNPAGATPVKIEAKPVSVADNVPLSSIRRSRLPYYVGGGAAAALGGAFAFELVGESTFDKAKAERDPTRQLSLWRSANVERYMAETVAAAGLTAAGVAVWLYVRDRREVRIAPAITGDRVGIQIVGGF